MNGSACPCAEGAAPAGFQARRQAATRQRRDDPASAPSPRALDCRREYRTAWAETDPGRHSPTAPAPEPELPSEATESVRATQSMDVEWETCYSASVLARRSPFFRFESATKCSVFRVALHRPPPCMYVSSTLTSACHHG